MKVIKKLLGIVFVLLFTVILVMSQPAHSSWNNQEEETILVGKISCVEGELLRYVSDEEDWVATDDDAPFGTNDVLYSSFDGKAEIIMPNNTWIRIGSDTQIQLIQLTDEATEIDLDSATARLYNKSSQAIIKATTAFGYVIAPAETIFDLYVNQNAVEIIALKGTVFFVHNSADRRYEVIAGLSSILADRRKVTANQGLVASGWDAWNTERDTLWRERMQAGGESAQYLPSGLDYEGHVLEDYGRWERVYYEGSNYYFWRPVHISVGWAPFTAGRWTVWYGDNTWISYEPFGYLTHHYGNWIFVNGYWYWAPPVSRRMIHAGLPLFDIGFGWYPGRVAWIYSDIHVGWITLAPYEYYYCHRRWGRRSVLINKANIIHFNLNINRYRNCGRSVIIERNNFYRVNNYNNVRIRNVSQKTIFKNYRPAPFLSKKVIGNYKKIKTKERFPNIPVGRSSNRTVINRTKNKQLTESSAAKGKIGAVQRQFSKESQSRKAGNSIITSEKSKSRLVSKEKSNRANSFFKVEKRDTKGETGYSTERQTLNISRTEKRQKIMLPKLSKRQNIQSQYQSQNRKETQSSLNRKTPVLEQKAQGHRSSKRGERIMATPNSRLQKQSLMVRNQETNKTRGNYSANVISGFNSRRSPLSPGTGFIPRSNFRR